MNESGEPRPPAPRFLSGPGAYLEAGITGNAAFREWDATAIVEAGDLRGGIVRFVVLPDRSIVVEEQAGDESLAPLADALERAIAPPYRAEAVRRGTARWAVGARAIDVVQLAGVPGDAVELAVHGGKRTLIVDGEETFLRLSALEALVADESDGYVLRAERLEGPLWELEIGRL